MRKPNYLKNTKWFNLTLISDRDGGENFSCCDNKTLFLCDCGEYHNATINNVSRGIVKFCKACSSNRKSELHVSHGMSFSRKDIDPIGYKAYYTWQAIKRRCYLKSDKRFEHYGARGITVCERWKDSFENFLEDMGMPESYDMSIDRINVDGNYEPINCRWATIIEQANNKRNNRVIEAFGKSMNLSQWASEVGIKRETIARRLNSGWDAERALSGKV
jgi:hypothetical protein